VTRAGCTFLEVERFDRRGLFGRSRLSSLATLDAALLGHGSTDWTRLASRLAAIGLLAPGQMQRIGHAWWFGRLIANTDMHTAGCAAALSSWKLAARDTRINERLRRISGLNAQRLQQVSEHV
jgi:hypothetical protein